jgi:hypothetical protein
VGTLAVFDGVLRRGLVNVDVGVARWLCRRGQGPAGQSQPLRTAPRHGVVYWKLGSQAALVVSGGVGGLKDDTMDSFERSGEVASTGTFGITTGWSLVARAAWMDNVRSATGAFNAIGAGVYLTRRF